MKKLLALLLMFCMLFSCVSLLSACNKDEAYIYAEDEDEDENEDKDEDEDDEGENEDDEDKKDDNDSIKTTEDGFESSSASDETTDTTTIPEAPQNSKYVVTVVTAGGMAMPEVDVYVYTDDTLTELVTYGQTDESGNVTFQLPVSDQYVAELRGVPKGYNLENNYSFSDGATNITLTSAPIQEERPSGVTLGLGDVVYDFSVTTPDGTIVTLSEVLKEKEMVMLSFWFSTCGPCASEFPYMEEAYQLYKDKMEIIAMSPSFYDDNNSVAAYKQSMGLSFPMAICNDNWPAAFGVFGYPTTVIVDRYGVICMIEVGAVTSQHTFVSVFEHFTADDYTQKVFENGMADLLPPL